MVGLVIVLLFTFFLLFGEIVCHELSGLQLESIGKLLHTYYEYMAVGENVSF